MNINYEIKTEEIVFEEINITYQPKEIYITFSTNGIYIDCDFNYKYIKGIEEPQYSERSYYQLIVTDVHKIIHAETEFTFTINTSNKEKLLKFLNHQFEEDLQFDDENSFT